MFWRGISIARKIVSQLPTTCFWVSGCPTGPLRHLSSWHLLDIGLHGWLAACKEHTSSPLSTYCTVHEPSGKGSWGRKCPKHVASQKTLYFQYLALGPQAQSSPTFSTEFGMCGGNWPQPCAREMVEQIRPWAFQTQNSTNWMIPFICSSRKHAFSVTKSVWLFVTPWTIAH